MFPYLDVLFIDGLRELCLGGVGALEMRRTERVPPPQLGQALRRGRAGRRQLLQVAVVADLALLVRHVQGAGLWGNKQI